MKYIYREEHNVYVDYEIDLNDEDLIENGINPYDDIEISNYIKLNFQKLQPESTEWWVSAQENTAVKKVGQVLSEGEENINWI